MIVQFDDLSAQWRIVNADGAIIKDGFATDAAAWVWADDHSEDDRADAVAVARIGTAIREW